MSLEDRLARALPALMSELLHGSPDMTVGTFMLNRGDEGLSASLDRLSATEASASSNGGATIAGHVEHLRYGLSLLNRWGSGDDAPWETADWTVAWRTTAVDDAKWKSLRADFRREAEAWLDAMRRPRDYDDAALKWIIGNIAHMAYHVGAIRQIARGARGPTAEDEAHAKVEKGVRG